SEFSESKASSGLPIDLRG
nr:enoyl reductase=34 kda polypeptide {N-terminal} [Brassica napus, cv. Jet Neuf, seed, Peptide Partial, 18 aa] [Brassica napus]